MTNASIFLLAPNVYLKHFIGQRMSLFLSLAHIWGAIHDDRIFIENIVNNEQEVNLFLALESWILYIQKWLCCYPSVPAPHNAPKKKKAPKFRHRNDIVMVTTFYKVPRAYEVRKCPCRLTFIMSHSGCDTQQLTAFIITPKLNFGSFMERNEFDSRYQIKFRGSFVHYDTWGLGRVGG